MLKDFNNGEAPTDDEVAYVFYKADSSTGWAG